MSAARPTSRARAKRAEQRFAEAMEIQRSGNFGEAERLLHKVVDTDPAHAQARHALALIAHRQGKPHQALDLMQRAAEGHGADASLFNNLGNMLREAGRRDEAVVAYRRALKYDDDNLNTHFNLAGLLVEAGDAAGAVCAYERVRACAPHDVAVLVGLARALLAVGQPDDALAHLARAREVAPDDPGCPIAMVHALLSSYRIHDALALARETVARWPDDIPAIHALAVAELVTEDYEGAEVTLRGILSREPNDADALMGLTRSLLGQNRIDDALSTCSEFIASHPDSPDGYACHGIALKRAGQLEEAVQALEKAVELYPDFAAAWSNLGQTWVDFGDTEKAQVALTRALELEPDQPEALFNVTNTRRNGPEHRDQIEHMAELAEVWHLNVDARLQLDFALGKAFDDLGEYDRAFHHYKRANELKRMTVEFLPDKFQTWVQGFHDTFNEEYFARCRGYGVSSERPIFIVGVPRSGTTLVEQILASHPLVFGADELPTVGELAISLAQLPGATEEFPRAASLLDQETSVRLGQSYLDYIATLDPASPRVTDKMPSNYFHLGLIAAILPGARVIHCRRNPMDTCLSNFIQLFGDHHYYSYDLDHIAVYYREYIRLMEHWRRVLPLPMHEVFYESMVEDPEHETRMLLEHLELPWDDACLDFHQTRRAVRTASHWQVRQPIYRTSRQRWRRYEPHLRDLAQAIGYQDSPEAPG